MNEETSRSDSFEPAASRQGALQVLNAQTAQTLALSECGEDVHQAEDTEDLFRQLEI